MSSTAARNGPDRRAVVLCTDRNMLIPALFVADAVRSHAGTAPGCDIVVVTDAEAATATEERWMQDRGIRHHVEDFAELRAVITLSGRLTTATLVKLILAEIFADRYDRILYLDTDLTIHGDVTRLFDLDLEGNALAAERRGVLFATDEDRSRGEAHFADLGMTKPYRYFNSGVMLIDVAAWRRRDLTARTLDYVRRNPELCLLPDEESLNAVLDGAFTVLSPVWNMAPRRSWQTRLHRFVEPAIVHYSGHDKPWRRFGRDKTLFPDGQAIALYRAFIRRSPWPNWLRSQWTLRDLRRSASHDLNRGLKRLRGKSPGPSRAEIERHLDRYRDHCATSRFADVEQGLVTRTGGRLRLDERNRSGGRGV